MGEKVILPNGWEVEIIDDQKEKKEKPVETTGKNSR